MESLISSELNAIKMHESIAQRAWWGLLIFPFVGYVNFAFILGYAPVSLGSIAYSILYLDPLLKINTLLDNLESGYLNSNKFSDEINACFDTNSKLFTDINIEDEQDTMNVMRRIRKLILTVMYLTLVTTIGSTLYWTTFPWFGACCWVPNPKKEKKKEPQQYDVVVIDTVAESP